MSFVVDNAVSQWEEGYRGLQGARSDHPEYRSLARAVVAVEEELRKRLGSSFTIAELAGLYREGGDWGLDVVMSAGPADRPPPIDSSALVDAAFYLYMREASDFAGGRRVQAG